MSVLCKKCINLINNTKRWPLFIEIASVDLRCIMAWVTIGLVVNFAISTLHGHYTDHHCTYMIQWHIKYIKGWLIRFVSNWRGGGLREVNQLPWSSAQQWVHNCFCIRDTMGYVLRSGKGFLYCSLFFTLIMYGTIRCQHSEKKIIV